MRSANPPLFLILLLIFFCSCCKTMIEYPYMSADHDLVLIYHMASRKHVVVAPKVTSQFEVDVASALPVPVGDDDREELRGQVFNILYCDHICSCFIKRPQLVLTDSKSFSLIAWKHEPPSVDFVQSSNDILTLSPVIILVSPPLRSVIFDIFSLIIKSSRLMIIIIYI